MVSTIRRTRTGTIQTGIGESGWAQVEMLRYQVYELWNRDKHRSILLTATTIPEAGGGWTTDNPDLESCTVRQCLPPDR